MCGYVAATGLCCTFAIGASQTLNAQAGAFAIVALAVGLLIRCIASVTSPPLAVINVVVALVSTPLLSANLLASCVSNALALLVLAYTIAITRKSIAGGRKRLGVEWQAQKALNFVDEFENTRPRLVLGNRPTRHPVLRLQPARRRFQVRARRAARPPVHRPSIGRHQRHGRLRGAQDARLPLVRQLPLLRRRRPPGERPGRPLVAVRQPDLRRARPLPRLPRHRHRPYRTAPLGAGDHPSRPFRFADRPAEPRDDAADARRSASQCAPTARRAAPCS